jgi:hypothetical protein
MVTAASRAVDINLDTLSREELLAHAKLQRRLIRKLHDQILLLEANQRDGATTTRVVTVSPQPPPQSARTVMSDSDPLSPNTRHNLVDELHRIHDTLASDEAHQLSSDTRAKLHTTQQQIVRLLDGSADVAFQPQQHDVQIVHSRMQSGSDRTAIEAFRDERLSAAMDVQRRGLAVHYNPSPATAPSHAYWQQQQQQQQQQHLSDSRGYNASAPMSPNASSASKLDLWRRQRTPRARHEEQHSRAQPLNMSSSHVRHPHSMVVAGGPRPRADTPPKRALAPPLMGDALGPGPRLLDMPALQDRIRARVDAMTPDRGGGSAPEYRVSPSSRRRPRQ